MQPAQSHEPTPEPQIQPPHTRAGDQAEPQIQPPHARAGDQAEPQIQPPHARACKRAKPIYRLTGWIVPERNPAGVVYGLITVGALLAAESGLRDTYLETVGSTAIAVTLYWFAHSYADVLGLRLSEQRRVEWQELWHTFVQDWSIARGAGVPLLALLVAWALGASQATAVAAGVWTVVGSLIAFEVAAGVRSRAKPVELVLEVLVGATLGLGILALRVVLH
jgi:hypothetical protein